MVITLYAVVNSKGRLRFNGRSGARVYEDQRKAQRWADRDGDTVVPVTFDDGRGDKPVFIRGQVINGGA
jgi:hypothetical protein